MKFSASKYTVVSYNPSVHAVMGILFIFCTGANFQKHKEDMMKLLGGEKAAMPPITIDVAPHGGSSMGSTSSTTTSRTYNTLSANSPHINSPAGSVSPGGVRIGQLLTIEY